MRRFREGDVVLYWDCLLKEFSLGLFTGYDQEDDEIVEIADQVTWYGLGVVWPHFVCNVVYIGKL